jgi:hypothetical protein
MRAALFCLCGLLGLSSACALDVIILKNGQKLEGLLEDSQETTAQLVLNKSTTVGILDPVTIAKSEIETLQRGDGSDDPAMQLELPKNSEEPIWYDLQIRRILDRWLKYHPKSPLTPTILEKRAAFVAEAEKSSRGFHRMGTRWMNPEEYKEVENDFLATQLAADLPRFASALQPLDLLEVLSKISASASCTAYPDVVELAVKAVTFTAQSLTTASLAASLDKRIARLRTAMAVEADFIRETVNTPPLSGASVRTTDSVLFADDHLYYTPNELAEPATGYSAFAAYYLPNTHPKVRLSPETLLALNNKLEKIADFQKQLTPLVKETEKVGTLYDDVLRKLKAQAEILQQIHVDDLRRAPKIWDEAARAAAARDFPKAAQLALQAQSFWPQLNRVPSHLDDHTRFQLTAARTALDTGKLSEADARWSTAKKIAALLPASHPRHASLDPAIREMETRLTAEHHRLSDDALSGILGALLHANLEHAQDLYTEAATHWPDNPGLKTAQYQIQLYHVVFWGGLILGALLILAFVFNGIPMLVAKFSRKPQPKRRSSLNRRK